MKNKPKPDRTLLPGMKHERCVCGHCRCGHNSGFAACTLCGCSRYTWPGKGADLPANHKGGKP